MNFGLQLVTSLFVSIGILGGIFLANWKIAILAGFFIGGSYLFIVIKTIRSGKQAKPEVWEGAGDLGLEWTLTSPPPYHSFTVQPQVK